MNEFHDYALGKFKNILDFSLLIDQLLFESK